MTQLSQDSSSSSLGHRLSRRRACLHAGAGVATLVAGVTGGHSRSIAAQEATAAATPSAGIGGTPTAAQVAIAVDQLPELARGILAKTGVPGMSIALVIGDSVVYAGGFGVRELGKPEVVDADTVFQLASVSKSLASTVVAAVVGDDQLAWNARLADIAPDFALADAWPTEQVTLADLFAHRSGLPDDAGDLLEDLGFGATEIIHRLRYLTPAYSFRAGYDYTNFGPSAAAYAVAAATGMAWPDLCTQRLYQPLGMTHTSSRFADYMTQAIRAIPHVQVDNQWRVTPHQRDPDAQAPAGGVSSTARDLAQWVRLQLAARVFDGTRVIATDALSPTHIPQSVSQPSQDPATQRAGFYGLGFNVSYTDAGLVQWSHSGAFASGAATALYLLPALNVGVLALTNGAPVGAPEALYLSVLDLIQQGTLSRDWIALLVPLFAELGVAEYGTELLAGGPTITGEAGADAAYLGTYGNDFYGHVDVGVAGGDLVLRLGPKPLTFALTHLGRDTFTWQPEGENAGGRSALVFSLGADGKATGFTDDYLGSGGPGTLARIR